MLNNASALMREPNTISIAEAARAFGYSEMTVRSVLWKARVPSVQRFRSLHLYRVDDVRRAIAEHRSQTGHHPTFRRKLCSERDCINEHNESGNRCAACEAKRRAPFRRAATLAEAEGLAQ